MRAVLLMAVLVAFRAGAAIPGIVAPTGIPAASAQQNIPASRNNLVTVAELNFIHAGRFVNLFHILYKKQLLFS